jgi:hypothetical protein
MPPGVSRAIKRRIVIGQGLYALGALLCVFGNIGVLSWLLNAGGLAKIVFPLNACEVAQIRC